MEPHLGRDQMQEMEGGPAPKAGPLAARDFLSPMLTVYVVPSSRVTPIFQKKPVQLAVR